MNMKYSCEHIQCICSITQSQSQSSRDTSSIMSVTVYLSNIIGNISIYKFILLSLFSVVAVVVVVHIT